MQRLPTLLACLLLLLLQVRPTPLEASMLQAAWGSNPLNHLLQSYQVTHPVTSATSAGMCAGLVLVGGCHCLTDAVRRLCCLLCLPPACCTHCM